MNERQARIQAIRGRNWRRYVRHFGLHECRYRPCRISDDANRLEAGLSWEQMRAADRQTSLWGVP